MSEGIKSLNTAYNGYRFRSRLEARWAVFFDTVGIQYEYEMEGFKLNKDTFYLPDFYLPQFDCWFEVKPREGDGDEKARLLSEGHRPVIVASGTPGSEHLLLYCNDFSESGGGSSTWNIKFNFDDTLRFAIAPGESTSHTICDFQWNELKWIDKHYHGVSIMCQLGYDSARGARFD